jgi:adenylosuccinate lyase
VIAPDATILLDFMLARFEAMMENLIIYPERMLANLNLTRGLIFSQMVLLKLVEKGMSREDAYTVVQKNAMKTWMEGVDFKSLLLGDSEVMACLSSEELDRIFRVDNFLGRLDMIFDRVFEGDDE